MPRQTRLDALGTYLCMRINVQSCSYPDKCMQNPIPLASSEYYAVANIVYSHNTCRCGWDLDNVH